MTEREQPERETIAFQIDPNDSSAGKLKWRASIGTKEEIDKKAEENGFPSRSAYLRHVTYLGMNTLVEQDPTNVNQNTPTQDSDAVTIRELVPEGEDNAVDMTSEFWEEILREKMLDIVEQDPVIERKGYSIYK